VELREGIGDDGDKHEEQLLTHDTTRPLKQGSLALSSEISSFTTLRGERRESKKIHRVTHITTLKATYIYIYKLYSGFRNY
jgi:hypothetical protein